MAPAFRPTASIAAAVDRASPERLARFIRFCDRGRPAWQGDPSHWSVHTLRCAAFVVADQFWAARATARYWRTYNAREAAQHFERAA